MIWVWLWQLAKLALMLVVPPRPVTAKPRLPEIDPDQTQCPACGNWGIQIQFSRMEDNQPWILCQCDTCKFKWVEKPVSRPEHSVS